MGSIIVLNIHLVGDNTHNIKKPNIMDVKTSKELYIDATKIVTIDVKYWVDCSDSIGYVPEIKFLGITFRKKELRYFPNSLRLKIDYTEDNPFKNYIIKNGILYKHSISIETVGGHGFNIHSNDINEIKDIVNKLKSENSNIVVVYKK